MAAKKKENTKGHLTTMAEHAAEVLDDWNTKRWTPEEKVEIVKCAEALEDAILQRLDGEDIDKVVPGIHARARKVAAHAGTTSTGVRVLQEALGRFSSHLLRGLSPQ